MTRRIAYVEADADGNIVHSFEVELAGIGFDNEGDAVVEALRAQASADAATAGHRLVHLTEDSRRPEELAALTVDAQGRLQETADSIALRNADPKLADPLAKVLQLVPDPRRS